VCFKQYSRRYIEYYDKLLVYEAVIMLEKHSIYLDCLVALNIMISNGRVQFLSVSSASHCHQDEFSYTAKEIEFLHQNKLKRLFNGFTDDKNTSCVVHSLA